MKRVFILLLVQFFIGSSLHSQNIQNEIVCRDSVLLDSVKVINEFFLKRVNSFYEKNKNSLDSNSYFLIENMAFKEYDTTSFIVIISIGNDLENDLMGVEEHNSCFFNLFNTLFLVRFLTNRYGIDLLFKRTTSNNMFFFNQRKYEAIGNGLSSTTAGYRVKLKNNSVSKIKKLYYFNYPTSRLQRFYYRICYRKYY
ncbi:MAG: hypothetical protein C0592_07490 [Marinilabiliales bacterium]|nr:MAG: hypothetical protein C0592_07490 [Marinilabiliales bacterium]